MKNKNAILIILLVAILAIVLILIIPRTQQQTQISQPQNEEDQDQLPNIIKGDLYGNIERVLPLARENLKETYVFVHNFKKGYSVNRSKIEEEPWIKASFGEVKGTFWDNKNAQNPTTIKELKAYVGINCNSNDFCLVSIIGTSPEMRLDFGGTLLQPE